MARWQKARLSGRIRPRHAWQKARLSGRIRPRHAVSARTPGYGSQPTMLRIDLELRVRGRRFCAQPRGAWHSALLVSSRGARALLERRVRTDTASGSPCPQDRSAASPRRCDWSRPGFVAGRTFVPSSFSDGFLVRRHAQPVAGPFGYSRGPDLAPRPDPIANPRACRAARWAARSRDARSAPASGTERSVLTVARRNRRDRQRRREAR